MDKVAVFTFGRFQPVTIGHEQLFNKMYAIANTHNGTPLVYLSHSFDKKKNPLTYDQRADHIKSVAGSIVVKSDARHFIDVLKDIHNRGYTQVHAVVGSDRTEDFSKLIHKYNGTEYNFKTVQVHNAGVRDEDKDGLIGASSTKARLYAASNDVSAFRSILPEKLKSQSGTILKQVRRGLNLNEHTAYKFIVDHWDLIKTTALESAVLYEAGDNEMLNKIVDKQTKQTVNRIIETVIPTTNARPGPQGIDVGLDTNLPNPNSPELQRRRAMKRFKVFQDVAT